MNTKDYSSKKLDDLQKELSAMLKNNVAKLETILNSIVYRQQEDGNIYKNLVTYNEEERIFYIYTKTGCLESASMKYKNLDIVKAINICVTYQYDIDLNYIINIVEAVKCFILECKDKITGNEKRIGNYAYK